MRNIMTVNSGSRLLPFVQAMTRPFFRYIIGIIAISFCWSVLVNIQPYLIKKILNSANSHTGQQLLSSLAPLLGFYLISSIIYIVIFRCYDHIISLFMPAQKEFITLHLVRHTTQRSFSFYQKNFAGSLTNKVLDVSSEIPEVVRIVCYKFLTCLLTLVLSFINMWWVSPRFSIAMLIWLIIFMGGSLHLLSRYSFVAKQASEVRSRVAGYIVDLLMNIMRVRLFVRAQYEELRMKQETSTLAHQEKQREYVFLKLHFFQGLSFWVFEAVCFFWLLQGLMKGSLTSGDFMLILTLNLQILDQFWSVAKEIRDCWTKIGHIQQGLGIIYSHDAMNTLNLETQSQVLEVKQGSITFENVHFFYEGSPPLFEDKTVTIAGQQKVGLVGYSGSGKSTFISLILRLYDVTSGRILIDGQDIRTLSCNSLYEAITVIPQESFLFNRSLMDNIRYGRLDASDEEVFQAAQRAQIHEMIQGLPKGYETLAGEKGGRLSGGQRQRIAIASAILKNSPILLMDEATSHLDVSTEKKVKKAFDELMRGKTVLVIAHRLSTLKNMDRLLVFDAGKIVQDGAHEELLQQEGLYRRLWQIQSQESQDMGGGSPL